jgi:nicotinamidase-related amidase
MTLPTQGKADLALLAMDLQCDYLQPEGRFRIAADQVQDLIAVMNRAIRVSMARHWPVIYIRNAFELLDFNNLFRNFATLAGSRGALLDPRILVAPGAPVFEKREPDAFSNPALGRELERLAVGRVVIGGVYADACVSATALAARRRGLRVGVMADAVGAASADARRRALARLQSSGVEVVRGAGLFG